MTTFSCWRRKSTSISADRWTRSSSTRPLKMMTWPLPLWQPPTCPQMMLQREVSSNTPVPEHIKDHTWPSSPGCCMDVPDYPFDEQYDSFAFNSLLTREEAISAIGKVGTECGKVAQMSLFHIPTAKHMRLEEFEQTQAQATSQVMFLFVSWSKQTMYTTAVLLQVSLFLKDSWITTLRAAIRTSLRDVGKGWFNLHETNWEVYQISKLKKFMEMVKFNMQVSQHPLVFIKCHQGRWDTHDCSFTGFPSLSGSRFIGELLPDDFGRLPLHSSVWGGNEMGQQCHHQLLQVSPLSIPFPISPYTLSFTGICLLHFRPKRNALFLVDLVMDAQGVHYSTNLNSFESVVVSLFDKGIQSTQNVPQLEKVCTPVVTNPLAAPTISTPGADFLCSTSWRTYSGLGLHSWSQLGSMNLLWRSCVQPSVMPSAMPSSPWRPMPESTSAFWSWWTWTSTNTSSTYTFIHPSHQPMSF